MGVVELPATDIAAKFCSAPPNQHAPRMWRARLCGQGPICYSSGHLGFLSHICAPQSQHCQDDLCSRIPGALFAAAAGCLIAALVLVLQNCALFRCISRDVLAVFKVGFLPSARKRWSDFRRAGKKSYAGHEPTR